MLAQSPFRFWSTADKHTGCQVAYSPTFGSMIVLGDDTKPKWVKMQYTKDDIGETMQDRMYNFDEKVATHTDT